MKCLFCKLIGISLILGGIVLELIWLGVCFGSIIIGILLLFLAPGILMAPLFFGISLGLGIINTGCEE